VAAVVAAVVELHKHFAVLLPQNLAVAVGVGVGAESVKETHCQFEEVVAAAAVVVEAV
jgi:hypothetical protein